MNSSHSLVYLKEPKGIEYVSIIWVKVDIILIVLGKPRVTRLLHFAKISVEREPILE